MARIRDDAGDTSWFHDFELTRGHVFLGVRYDHSRGAFPSLPFLNAAGESTGQMSTANDDVYHWNTISPRVGLNWQVTESGNTVIKAHYGRYYKALEPGEFRGAVPSISPAFSFTQSAAGVRSNFVQTSSNANLRIDPGFKSAYNDQVMVQLEQQLVADLGLQVNYVHKDGADYGAWQDIAGTYVQVPYVDSVGIDATEIESVRAEMARMVDAHRRSGAGSCLSSAPPRPREDRASGRWTASLATPGEA